MDIQPLSLSKTFVVHALDKLVSTISGAAERYLTGRGFCWKIAAATTILSLLTTFPGFYSGKTPDFKGPEAEALSWKVLHPLSPIPSRLKNPSLYSGDEAGAASHADKMELRVTVPILGWLGRTGVWTVLIWNPIAGFGTFYLLARLASEALSDETGAALFVLGLGPTFFGSWFFNDVYLGDGIAFFFMTLSITCWVPLLSTLSFLAAAFCDERCLTTLPLMLFYVAVRFRMPDQLAQRRHIVAALISAVLLWALLRWFLMHAFGDSMGTSGIMSKEILRYHLTQNIPGALLNVFRASWSLPVFAIFSLIFGKRWRAGMILSASLALAILPAFLVFDFQRSVAYTFVVLPISLYFLQGEPALSNKSLAAILVANTLLASPGLSIVRVLSWIP
jgi:hypothetical protein